MSAASPLQTRDAIVDLLQGDDEVRARLGSHEVRRLAADIQALPETDPRLQLLTVIDGEVWATRIVGRRPRILTADDIVDAFHVA